ncbi:hypothetical protein QN277_027247 [Acacia crassicarpa]|uniref:Ankyrin repeat domain-containing protein n=1 Tax=Acacia crassicarpa TaxID=499986 RepID=A0AAE1MI97_9FABA|nr:hypothetical protein QN277_027247 [Acacia crassicarpa]
MADIDVSKYAHSPVHKALLLKDYAGLKEMLAGLPRLRKADEIDTEAESIAEEKKAEDISAIVDCRDVPNRDTPLHLAARLGDMKAAQMLLVAGANKNLKNRQGWSALTEAIINQQEEIGLLMIRYSYNHYDDKFYRRLPRYIATMRTMRDFYMEITFHFESSVIPFISKIAPSDTFKIWKRGANMRADMTLAGFDGLKIKRADQSALFLGDGLEDGKKLTGIPLCIIAHKHKKVYSSHPRRAPSNHEIRQIYNMKSRESKPKIRIDTSQAFLAPQLTWRKKKRKEMVGPWKAKVYDMRNVHVSIKSKKGPGAKTVDKLSAHENKKMSNDIEEILTEEERKQLELVLEQNLDSLELNTEDEFDHGKTEKKEKKERGRKEKENKKGRHNKAPFEDSDSSKEGSRGGEYKRGMRPSLWFSPDFPLKVEELLPLLDILAEKVKAIRRFRDILTTKLPKDTFPVKVAIPVVPTVRVFISFTKFEELPPLEEFSSAPSSPTSEDLEDHPAGKSPSSSWFQWIKGHPGSSSSGSNSNIQDIFSIPSDYTWISCESTNKQGQEKRDRNIP